MITSYPLPDLSPFAWRDVQIESSMQDVLNVVHAVRGIRKDYSMTSDQQLDLFIVTDDQPLQSFLSLHRQDLLLLCKAKDLQFQATSVEIDGKVILVMI